ncbi:MAG: PilZ domain-containing protein [Candidatus Omnitrophica bacterium]|nr:PilZ domain-containing protein [Candidatus Omnitrophota bacterium]
MSIKQQPKSFQPTSLISLTPNNINAGREWVSLQNSLIDRRVHPRFDFGQTASVLSSAWVKKKPVDGHIADISLSGLSLNLPESIPSGRDVTIFLPLPIVEKPFQILGRVIWTNQRGPLSTTHGIVISDSLVNKDVFENFIDALAKLKKPGSRRLIDAEHHEYPLKNRRVDYRVLSHESPYVSFFQTLEEEAKREQIDTIVLSNSLAYLQKRIRRIVADFPRITLASDLKPSAHGNTLVILNLDCRRKHEHFTLLDFDEYRLKNHGVAEPVFTLNRVSESLAEREHVTFLSLGVIRNQKLAQKYLQIARFEKINWDGNNRRVTASKRKLLNQPINGGGLILRETQSQSDIHRLQEFSIKFYSAGYNFKKEIDGVFSEYSHFYLVEKANTNEIVTCARVTWHLPGLYLPCMLAVKEGTEDHIQLQDPDKFSYGEIYAPYFSSMSALKAYGELVRRFIYYTEEKFIDAYLTTHNVDRSAESRFLSQYLGFKETNVVLKYGDFGGLWNLIYLTQNNLDKNIRLNFSCPEKSPRFINTFRNH